VKLHLLEVGEGRAVAVDQHFEARSEMCSTGR